MDGGLFNKQVKRIYGGGSLAGALTMGMIIVLLILTK
jgi:hypothetical protein